VPEVPGSVPGPGAPARGAVDRTVDALRDRFGRDAVGYARVALRADRGVPDAFRELAESDVGGPTDRPGG